MTEFYYYYYQIDKRNIAMNETAPNETKHASSSSCPPLLLIPAGAILHTLTLLIWIPPRIAKAIIDSCAVPAIAWWVAENPMDYAVSRDEEAPLVANELSSQAPRVHTRDVHVMSCGFLLVFLSYGAAQNLESSVDTASSCLALCWKKSFLKSWNV